MKKSIFLAALCLMNVVLMAQDYELRVLTFEDKDAKFMKYSLDYADGWVGRDIATWSDLVDDPQYGGPLTYADYMSAEYHWYDEGNTELAHTFPDNYAYCFWGGGHAISNYWGAGWSDEDRDTHIAKYYGKDYVTENAGNDAMLGWFNLQMMVPVQPHSGDNFAVHYGYKDFFTYIENLPEISFEDGKKRVIDHMYVINTNYTLNQLYHGVKSEAGNSFGGNWDGLTDNAWLKIVAYSFDDVDADAYTTPKDSVEFYLVKGKNVVTDWQKWDLSALGEVAKVRFNFLYSDEMGGKYGFTIPGYFAYDDIAVRFPKTKVEPIVVEYTETTCDSYTWNGNTYTESGDYTVTLQTEQGRDSIENLHLTILPEAEVENEELVLCPSELPYEWYGQSLAKAGSYTATEQYTGMECDSVIHELTLNVYVQTLPASVTLPIVRAGEAINIEASTAEINAHIAADSWYAPNAVVAWYIQSNDTWSALTEEPVKAGISNIVLKYAVNSDCGSIESEVMNISVTTTAIENTQGNATQIYKIIHNGQLLIIRDGKTYNTMGQSLSNF